MPAEIRFHLDECVAVAIADGLRRRGIDVTTTRESGLISSGDLDQLAFATQEERVLITQDSDFLRLAREGHLHYEIAYYTPGSRTIGDLISRLVLMQPEDVTSLTFVWHLSGIYLAEIATESASRFWTSL